MMTIRIRPGAEKTRLMSWTSIVRISGMGLSSRKSSGPVAVPHQQAGHRTVSETGKSKPSQLILAKREPSTQDIGSLANLTDFSNPKSENRAPPRVLSYP